MATKHREGVEPSTTETTETPAASGELVTRHKNGTSVSTQSEVNETSTLLKSMGFADDDVNQFERTSTGGVTKWIDLTAFMEDPTTAANKPAKGNGKAFGGVLMAVNEMEVDDKDNGELNADGVKVRYFYTLRLSAPCPITWKDEDKVEHKGIANEGDVVSIGERHDFKKAGWRQMCNDGGIYLVVVRPHSRIRIDGGHTMWTFDAWKRVLRPPIKVVGVQGKPLPF